MADPWPPGPSQGGYQGGYPAASPYQAGWVVAPGDGWVAPKGWTPDGRVVAEPGRRVLAFLVDMAIWTVPQVLVVGATLVAVFSTLADPENESGEASGRDAILVLSLYGVLFALGLLRLAVEAELVARRGQTWGMKALHLRVIDGRTGGAIGRGRAWGRAAFGTWISSQLFGLGYWWAFFDDRKRTLHDLVCTTVVVDERTGPAAAP